MLEAAYLALNPEPHHRRRSPDPDWEQWAKGYNRNFDLLRDDAYIDAAMMLKDGVAVLITLSEIKGDGMPHCVLGNPETSALFGAVAETPALALAAAALRAHAA